MDYKVKANTVLADRRKERGLTQKQLAGAAAGMTEKPLSWAAYNKAEQGVRTISLMHAQAIARLLGYPAAVLFEPVGDQENV